MDSASQKRKPGSGLTRRACYVWLQRPSPLGFSMPVNSAPFISLWFHGNVQNTQQVAVSPGGEGSARGPSHGHSTLHSRGPAVGGCPSVSLPPFLWCAPQPWATLPTAPLSRPPLSGSRLSAPPGLGDSGTTLLSPFPIRSSSHCSAHRATDFPSHPAPGALAFSTTLHSIWGRWESSGSPWRVTTASIPSGCSSTEKGPTSGSLLF